MEREPLFIIKWCQVNYELYIMKTHNEKRVEWREREREREREENFIILLVHSIQFDHHHHHHKQSPAAAAALYMKIEFWIANKELLLLALAQRISTISLLLCSASQITAYWAERKRGIDVTSSIVMFSIVIISEEREIEGGR
jgi:hypothetical protein